MKNWVPVAGISLVVLSGCSSMSPVQLGQTAGTIAGALAAPGVGAPIGALVGILTGMVVQQQMDQVTEKHERKELGEQLGRSGVVASDQPPRPVGEPTRVWVDESVQDGRTLAGHFETRDL